MNAHPLKVLAAIATATIVIAVASWWLVGRPGHEAAPPTTTTTILDPTVVPAPTAAICPEPTTTPVPTEAVPVESEPSPRTIALRVVRLGKALYGEQQYEEARNLFAQARDMAPELNDPSIWIAGCNRRIGERDRRIGLRKPRDLYRMSLTVEQIGSIAEGYYAASEGLSRGEARRAGEAYSERFLPLTATGGRRERPALKLEVGDCPKGGQHQPGTRDANGRLHCRKCGRFM